MGKTVKDTKVSRRFIVLKINSKQLSIGHQSYNPFQDTGLGQFPLIPWYLNSETS